MLTPHDLDRLLGETCVRCVEFHRVIASTNDRALEFALKERLETPLLIAAAELTAGRGRGRNRWWARAGALTFSLVLEPEAQGIARHKWPRISLVAGLSVGEAVQQMLPGVPCGLKWPNDVWLGGRKVCGILVEVPPHRPPRPARLVLGIGLNVNNSLADAPEEIQTRATSLVDQAGGMFAIGDVLRGILGRLAQNLEALAADDPGLVETWQAHCVLRGRVVEVTQGEHPLRGLCAGIDSEGALLIETAHGRERLFGGVVTSIA
jgi:BirA family biotin operon repressor/biotin-[acetyl-CoA-carboxylase] ligase